MWHAFADTRGLRHSFVRSKHLATPWRRRAPWDAPLPLGGGTFSSGMIAEVTGGGDRGNEAGPEL
jgi:hypothetical protein